MATELIDFTCPFCKIECDESGDVVLADADNPMTLDMNSDSPKVMIHMTCLETFYKENKNE